MIKIRKYILALSIAVLFVLTLHQILLHFGAFNLNFKIALLGDIALGVIFGTGILLTYPAFKRADSEFIGRFMILTTIQFLEVLSLITFFIFKNVPKFRMQAFHIIGLFVVLLAIQSVLLIRQVKK